LLHSAGGVKLLLNKLNWHIIFGISSKSTRYSQLGTIFDNVLNDPDSGFTLAKWSTVADNADSSSISSTLELVSQHARSQYDVDFSLLFITGNLK
jgi:hypothetical protein